MPRVADIYSRPTGIDAVPNATIESVDYNANVADVEADLNFPRPVVAGGTGGNSASAARTNLQAEMSKQVVTNYDSMVWENGSFYSAAGATSAPTANAFTGIAYATDINNIVVEARDMTTGIKYMRKKSAGTWGSWLADSGSGAFVQKGGDMMTGNLMITTDGPQFTLNNTGSSSQSLFSGTKNGVSRWSVSVGDGNLETGADVGSNFAIGRSHDNGVFIDSPLTINRATGLTTLKNTQMDNLTMLGVLATKGTVGGIANATPVHGLEVRSAAGANAAYLTLFRTGLFAASLGLDTDNQLKYGGETVGSIAYRILHEGNSPSTNKYFKFPSGMQLVMDVVAAAGDGWITFPVAFPTACVGVVCTVFGVVASTNLTVVGCQQTLPTGFYAQPRNVASGGTVGSATCNVSYIAWGN